MKQTKMQFTIMLFALFMSANTVWAETTSVQRIVYQSEACTIIEVRDGNNIFYHVLAAIATEYLPDAVYKICMLTLGDDRVCSAVYNATAALIELDAGATIRRMTQGIRWIASKGWGKSEVKFEKISYETATAIASMLKIYRTSCVPWEQIDHRKG